ncbi:hypothetical protein FALBO_11426 [Fusarium albosuccineum]|uniref:Uncharacterized protein n=1 Tax=Fusarium albosuccineum TaxID=1237068 RepID=A0A8H4L2A4_9HYPO|nr:hypothetical protein FALBO_11426 [Fusarium albosuccineum]
MASPTQRTLWGDLIEWSVEVDFLVAKQKTGQSYAVESGKRIRWACPANEPKPTETCVQHCAEHIAYTLGIKPYALGGVAYQEMAAPENDFDYTIEKVGRERSGIDPRMNYWFVSPAPNAVARSDSPSEYDWVGVRLRCPLRSLLSILPKDRYGEEDLGRGIAHSGAMAPIPPVRGKIEMESVLGLVRAGIKIHTNSTCQLRIYMNLQHDGFDLTDAKKAITLAWLMEPELLLPLRPYTRDPSRSHCLPITRLSKIALTPTKFPAKGYSSLTPDQCERLLAQTRPLFPTDAELMDTHIPEMMNSHVQERIQMIWGASTPSELSNLLKSPDGETTVALNVLPDFHPTLVFRYGLWHPQRENMQYWLQLFGRLFLFAVASDSRRFQSVVGRLEKHALEVQKLERQDRWKAMLTHSFDNVMSHYWNSKFKDAERDDGVLSPKGLDCQGVLEPVAEINYESDSDERSSSSSSSSSDGADGGVWLKKP